jgi:tetratricopeptide (TPR) repeat protein
MMMYRLKPKPLPEVARELQATHLIEGSVRREANAVRLTLQLIDARTDVHEWSQNYDRTLANALTLESEVADEVASQLKQRLAEASQPAGPPTSDPAAYDAYLKARIAIQLTSPYAPVERLREIESLLTSAIARDPSFARAYVERASVRLSLFDWNYDTGEANVRRVSEDIAAAKRLAPDDPNVLAAEAVYFGHIQRDSQRALHAFQAADAAGLSDTTWRMREALLLGQAEQIDAAIRLIQQLSTLDPQNAYVNGVAGTMLSFLDRPQEALRYVDRGLLVSPESVALRTLHGTIVWAYTGNVSELHQAVTRYGSAVDTATLRELQFGLYRVEHRYAELRQVLEAEPARTLRINSLTGGSGVLVGVGERPVAQFLGWTYFLLGDKSAAARAGRAVLDFVAHTHATPWNQRFLNALRADGYALTQDCPRATALTRENLPQSRAPLEWRARALAAARVYAWCNTPDQAIAVLDDLATREPKVPPAVIVDDPLYAVPLANQPGFQQLNAQLRARMAATKL